MNREAYELANRIEAEFGADADHLEESPDDMEMKRIKTHVLQEIKKEKQTKKKNFRDVTAAACAALMLLAGTVFFGDEVHAMMKQISFSIGNALGISSDLADYRKVVNSSITDGEYIVTLQEVAATEEKLIISYTIGREDGQSPEELIDASGGANLEKGIYPETDLYINGEKAQSAILADYRFIDEEKTVVGAVAQLQFLTSETDITQENEYKIGFYRNRWNIAFHVGEFSFKADGTDLIADTKRTDINKTFELPDGVKVTLNELAINELEQRISYSLSAYTHYIIKVRAVDSAGNQAEFGTRVQGSESGYMQNGRTVYDGRVYDSRLDDNAETVTMTLYAVELLNESGKAGCDYEQIGENFELKLR